MFLLNDIICIGNPGELSSAQAKFEYIELGLNLDMLSLSWTVQSQLKLDEGTVAKLDSFALKSIWFCKFLAYKFYNNILRWL